MVIVQRGLFAVVAAAIFSGCGGAQPLPSGRLRQPAGKFSFVTPDGWFRTKLAGIDFIIVSGDTDAGSTPNLFVEFVKPGSVRAVTQQVIEAYQSTHRSYEVDHQADFTTESGLAGIKVTARRETTDALPLATIHYLIQDSERVIAITATCAEPVKQKYEPLFDAAMKSVRSD